jgi:hypothetical protein
VRQRVAAQRTAGLRPCLDTPSIAEEHWPACAFGLESAVASVKGVGMQVQQGACSHRCCGALTTRTQTLSALGGCVPSAAWQPVSPKGMRDKENDLPPRVVLQQLATTLRRSLLDSAYSRLHCPTRVSRVGGRACGLQR